MGRYSSLNLGVVAFEKASNSACTLLQNAFGVGEDLLKMIFGDAEMKSKMQPGVGRF